MLARSRSPLRKLGGLCVVTFGIFTLLVGLVRVTELDGYDALANSHMVENWPTPDTSKLLKDELLFQRATQTYLWAQPMINTLGMKVGSEMAFIKHAMSAGAGNHRSSSSATRPVRIVCTSGSTTR